MVKLLLAVIIFSVPAAVAADGQRRRLLAPELSKPAPGQLLKWTRASGPSEAVR